MHASARRIVLLPEPRDAREGKIRRFRLARVKLDAADARDARDELRFAHLKRLYD